MYVKDQNQVDVLYKDLGRWNHIYLLVRVVLVFYKEIKFNNSLNKNYKTNTSHGKKFCPKHPIPVKMDSKYYKQMSTKKKKIYIYIYIIYTYIYI